MAVDVVKGMREAIQDPLAPELSELRAEMRANTQRLAGNTDRRFMHIEYPLDAYEDVQLLTQQVAVLRARQQPSA